MGCLGNILWFVFGGVWLGLAWTAAGLLWCVSIIGIPIGLQCFKLAGLAFFPFGREVVYGGGAVSFIANVLWFILSGFWLGAASFVLGVIFCLSIIGIPFGLQCFKLGKLAFAPFGAEVR